MEHYFTNNSQTKHNVKPTNYYINDEVLTFYTDNAVFAKSKIDFGTSLLNHYLIEEVDTNNKQILDVGCGYGAIGLTIGYFDSTANLTMVDINERAVELCRINADKLLNRPVTVLQSDLLTNVTGTYDIVVTNPPIRTGKANIFNLYTQAYDKLNIGGSIYVVIQKKQGAPSTRQKLTELFGNCELVKRDAGYFILSSTKQA